ncbi:MAG: hypothetical protein RQ839_10020 [Thermoproteus sp.]|jgi:hypothetical protein|nr:hypothetical protein [Thermoproteus sp.]MDT7882906.1 hypothetical protein [Thermoproteus sp.]
MERGLGMLLYALSATSIAFGVLLLVLYPGRRSLALAALGISMGIAAPIAYRALSRRE